jgi:hypothetical protein
VGDSPWIDLFGDGSGVLPSFRHCQWGFSV